MSESNLPSCLIRLARALSWLARLQSPRCCLNMAFEMHIQGVSALNHAIALRVRLYLVIMAREDTDQLSAFREPDHPQRLGRDLPRWACPSHGLPTGCVGCPAGSILDAFASAGRCWLRYRYNRMPKEPANWKPIFTKALGSTTDQAPR